MQHVDEGILHAYLDGAIDSLAAAGALPRGVTPAEVQAHLRSCADCRALLERERALRTDAGAILQAAALDHVDVPPFPFEEAEPAPRRRSRGLPVAWAASVLLALGAGWWGNAMLRDAGAATDAAEVAEAGPSVPSAPSDVGVPARAGAEMAAAVGDASAPAITGGDVVVASAEPAVSTAQASAAPGDEEEPVVASDPGIRAGLVTVATAQRLLPRSSVVQLTANPRAGRDAASAGLAAAPTGAAPDMTITPQSALGFNTLPTTRLPGVQQSALQGGVLPGGMVGGGGLARPGTALRADAPEARAGAPLDTFRDLVNAARAGALEWQPTTPRDAGVAPLILVQGAEVELLEAVAVPGPARLVRVRQVLPDGATIELLQWQGTAGEAGRAQAGTDVVTTVVASGSAPQGGREVLLRAPALGSYLMLSGDLDVRRLSALADALIVMP